MGNDGLDYGDPVMGNLPHYLSSCCRYIPSSKRLRIDQRRSSSWDAELEFQTGTYINGISSEIQEVVLRCVSAGRFPCEKDIASVLRKKGVKKITIYSARAADTSFLLGIKPYIELRKLHVIGSIGTPGNGVLTQMVSTFLGLEVLSLHYCDRITIGGWLEFMTAICRQGILRKLDIRGTFNGTVISCLGSMIVKTPSVQKLYLSSITHVEFSKLVPYIHKSYVTSIGLSLSTKPMPQPWMFDCVVDLISGSPSELQVKIGLGYIVMGNKKLKWFLENYKYRVEITLDDNLDHSSIETALHIMRVNRKIFIRSSGAGVGSSMIGIVAENNFRIFGDIDRRPILMEYMDVAVRTVDY